jgi:hypothetical protein
MRSINWNWKTVRIDTFVWMKKDIQNCIPVFSKFKSDIVMNFRINDTESSICEM